MIIDERMAAFIDSLDKGNTPFLDKIEKDALADQVPIIRKSMQSLLKFLLALTRPRNILEVGTAVGFSALLMDEYSPAGCRITTIEKYEKRIPVAAENFKRAGAEDRITLLEGDAAEILKTLEDSYDFIFMAVYSFSAGYYPAADAGRYPDIGQRAAGRGHRRITICRDKAQPHHSCQNEGLPL